jgi:hypothetical protein
VFDVRVGVVAAVVVVVYAVFRGLVDVGDVVFGVHAA